MKLDDIRHNTAYGMAECAERAGDFRAAAILYGRARIGIIGHNRRDRYQAASAHCAKLAGMDDVPVWNPPRDVIEPYTGKLDD